MQVHNLKQGSAEWCQLRTQYFTASEAPVMMGCGHVSRNDLLKQKALGIVDEPTPELQLLFDRGHATEAQYRPIATKLIGGDLYPITASIEIQGLKLLASSDGVTMMGDVGFEHKLLNKSLADMIISDGEPGPKWYWQLEQQILVMEVERILFVTSDGTEDGATYCWYTSKPERRAALIAGWKQFAEDLAGYKYQEHAPKLVGTASTQSLPALLVDVTGEVAVNSNVDKFLEAATVFVEGMKAAPETDQDFANAEADIRQCEDVEGNVDRMIENVMTHVSPVDEVVRVLERVKEMVRAARLNREKQVKAKKDSIKAERIEAARLMLSNYIKAQNEALGQDLMPTIPCDLATAAKNKRTIKSLQDSIDQAVAQAKTEANAIFDVIKANLALVHNDGDDLGFLFPDLAMVCRKPTEDFANLLTARRTENDERIKKEAEALAAANQASAAPTETAETAETALATPVAATSTGDDAFSMARLFPMGAPKTSSEPGQRLNLTRINAILSPVSITAAGLSGLGFQPVEVVRGANLYEESELASICAAIARHVMSVSRTAKA